MSNHCKAELLRWRNVLGAEFSEYVFPDPQRPETHLKDVRKAWPKVLKAAGIPYFWIYDSRSAFTSRLTEAGVSPVFVAQISSHSGTGVLGIYAKAIDEYRRSAISRLEGLRQGAQCTQLNRSEQVIQ